MSGKILVIDSVATNRIVLKVKLSAAFYNVSQASSISDALKITANRMPQVILCAADLPDGTVSQLIRKLSAQPGGDRVPVMALTARNDAETRLRLLSSGAHDVLSRSFCEKELLARLRRLNRRRQNTADLAIKSDTARALGFAETPAHFREPGHVLVIASGGSRLQDLTTVLGEHSTHHFTFGTLGPSDQTNPRNPSDIGLGGAARAPDVVLMRVGETPQDPGLAQLAELRIAENTRHARIIVALDTTNAALAASVLDMGADEIVDASMDPREISLRLDQQVRSKQADDQRRNRLQTGLEAAVTDPLTGLYNRRFAMAELQRLIDQSTRDGSSFTAMLADLDHFKSVNDTYGHVAGDVVLARVASFLRHSLSETDIVARIGGEEFLVLLPNSDRHQASATADRLCDIVRSAEIALPNHASPVRVTISIGVTVAETQNALVPPTVEGVLGQADTALYGSKSDGRDTVTFNQLSAA